MRWTEQWPPLSADSCIHERSNYQTGCDATSQYTLHFTPAEICVFGNMVNLLKYLRKMGHKWAFLVIASVCLAQGRSSKIFMLRNLKLLTLSTSFLPKGTGTWTRGLPFLKSTCSSLVSVILRATLLFWHQSIRLSILLQHTDSSLPVAHPTAVILTAITEMFCVICMR